MRSLSRLVQVLGVAILLTGAAWQYLQPRAPVVEGFARVVDGDSIEVAGISIRLVGIDAPEYRQTCTRAGQSWRCGEEVRAALLARLAGRQVSCRITGRDRYRRSLAKCSVGGEDIGGWLVGSGFAVGYRGHEREEAWAQSRSLGLWAGEFQRPADWRREHASRSKPPPNEDCDGFLCALAHIIMRLWR